MFSCHRAADTYKPAGIEDSSIKLSYLYYQLNVFRSFRGSLWGELPTAFNTLGLINTSFLSPGRQTGPPLAH
jgi:hypothetical protein